MNEYVIMTDSACDMKPELLAEWGVPFRSLTYRFDGSDQEYTDSSIPAVEFYAKMKAGSVAKTSAVNSESFLQMFEEALKNGKDVLYLGFSSGLSTTFNSARIASLDLAERYPDRKITVVDTLAASAGFGLLVYLAVQKKNAGASMDEVAAYIEELKWKTCLWFTVDDLVYLKRGGRISPTAAFVGNVLGIKPVLHMDNEGHLINMFKVRGRKTAVTSLADQYGKLAEDPAGGTVFISHADCMNDVEELVSILKERYGASVQIITDVGPVIGAHSGPGTLALFFIGKEK
jgi:DegV family protein with EDD domain